MRKLDWNAICDVCGFKKKASELRERWDGLMVCEDDWEPRHPQDYLRVFPDFRPLPFTRPEAPDVFINVDFNDAYAQCPVTGHFAVPLMGVAGCMTAGYPIPL